MRIPPGMENPTLQSPRQNFVAVRKPGNQKFGKATTLGPKGAEHFDLAAAKGKAIAAATWLSPTDGLEIAFWTPREGWGEPVSLDPSTETEGIDLVMGPDGTTVVSWRTEAGSESAGRDSEGIGLRYRVKTPGKGWSPVREFASRTSRGPYWSAVALRNGVASIAWSGACLGGIESSFPTVVVEVQGPKVLRWQEVKGSQCPDAGISVAYDDTGSRYLVANGSLNVKGGIRLATAAKNRHFGRIRKIRRAGPIADFAQIASLGHKMLVVWSRFTRRAGADGAAYAVVNADGEITRSRRVPGSAGKSFAALASGRAGKAAIIMSNLKTHRIEATTFSKSRWARKPSTVSPQLDRRVLPQPSLAFGGWEPSVIWTRPTPRRTGNGISISTRRSLLPKPETRP